MAGGGDNRRGGISALKIKNSVRFLHGIKKSSAIHSNFPSGIRFCPSACGWCPKPFGPSRRKIVAENLHADPLRLSGFLLLRNNFPKAP